MTYKAGVATTVPRLRVFWRRLDEDSGQASIEEFGPRPRVWAPFLELSVLIANAPVRMKNLFS